jgi:type III secretory pathway component EscT
MLAVLLILPFMELTLLKSQVRVAMVASFASLLHPSMRKGDKKKKVKIK